MYFSVTQTAEILGVSPARVRKLVSTGRIQGAFKIANVWAIPLVDGKPVAKPGRRGPKLSWSKRRPQAVSKIHVNQNIIRQNQKTGDRSPVITVKQSNRNVYGHEVLINGPCRVVYQPDKPLDCKAKVWIETFSKVEVICKDFNHIIDISGFG